MSNTHSKAYSATLHDAAMRIVFTSCIDALGNLQLMPGSDETRRMARQLESETGCSYASARNHVAEALRILRNPNHRETREWGGKRDGSGRPRKVTE